MKTLSKLDTQNRTLNSRPEIELILCCIRPAVDDGVTERIKSLVQNEIDWKYLIYTVTRHGLISLFYTRVNSICPELVPEAVSNELRGRFGAIAQRNLFLTGELVKLLRLLKEQDIVALPYKGPVLATLIYGNVALRRFGDLDIIVQQQDIKAVQKLLIAQGYRPNIEMTDTQLSAYLNSKTEHTYDFVDDERNIFLEIHWRIAPKYITPITAKDIWTDLQPFSLAGTTINNLPLETWLPILCVHGSRHMWERLSWLCDIATLIHHNPDLDWDKVFEVAKVWGCRRMLCLGLLMTKNLFGVILPDAILQRVKAETVASAIAPHIYQQLFDEFRSSDKFMGRTLYHIQVRESLYQKLLYVESFVYWLIKGKKSIPDRTYAKHNAS